MGTLNPHAIAQLAVQDHKAAQKPAELAIVLALLACDPPKLVVEIGTLAGGTTWAWSRVAHHAALIVGVDIEPHDHAKLVKDTQTYVPVVGDSTDPETVDRVGEVLAGNRPDFTFIDGQHTEAVARADLQNYRGHITGLHDILFPLNDYWARLECPGSVSIIADRGNDNEGWGPWGGIGLLL